MVETTQELWDRMLSENPNPWMHYTEKWTSVFVKTDDGAIRLGYTMKVGSRQKYYMIRELAEAYSLEK